MIYNPIIDQLKLWCKDAASAYETGSDSYGGLASTARLAAYEWNEKLSMLIDRPFNNVEALYHGIEKMADVHYYPSLKKPECKLAARIMEKINKEFFEHLQSIISDQQALLPANIPYRRVLLGDEKRALQEKFQKVWGYQNTSYWFPLMGEKPKEIADKFFVMFDYLEPYMQQLEQLIGLPQVHIYSCGETFYAPTDVCETVELIEYNGCEIMYTDKDFSWAIYFSHEGTVAFAGAIVPAVKELLAAEKIHWDKWK